MNVSDTYSPLPPVKILWINPIGLSTYDRPMADVLAQIKQPSTSLELVSLRMDTSPDNLEYRTFESLIVRETVELARYAAVSGFDGTVIGCFYDPALLEAREISGGAVVVAPCEASVRIATRLCNRFSIIVGQTFWIEQMTQRVREYGLEHKLASMRSIDCPVCQMQTDVPRTKQLIANAAKRAIEEDGAEAIILGCTCEFGMFRELQQILGVPVIDPVFAAFKECEFAAGLGAAYGWKPSRAGSCRAPSEHDLDRFRVFERPPPIGNRVLVPSQGKQPA
jgi:allantoin racemase